MATSSERANRTPPTGRLTVINALRRNFTRDGASSETKLTQDPILQRSVVRENEKARPPKWSCTAPPNTAIVVGIPWTATHSLMWTTRPCCALLFEASESEVARWDRRALPDG